MTREVVACRPEDDLRQAQQLMGDRCKSRILCTSEAGQLLGVISLSDIAQLDGSVDAVATLRKVSSREVRSVESAWVVAGRK